MATAYPQRLLCIVPDARKAALVAWWNANIEPGQGANTLAVPLSATGSLPATHWWFSGAFTVPELRQIIVRLCSLAGITPPTVAQYNNSTNEQRRQWIRNAREDIYAATGIAVTPDDNEGPWADPDEVLAVLGLQRIQAEQP